MTNMSPHNRDNHRTNPPGVRVLAPERRGGDALPLRLLEVQQQAPPPEEVQGALQQTQHGIQRPASLRGEHGVQLVISFNMQASPIEDSLNVKSHSAICYHCEKYN